MSPSEPTPRRFGPEALARLLEITSTVQCECPNHLARIVSAVVAFEDYARGCEDRNAEDARVHRLLYDHAVQARAILDEALAQLLVHEGISLES